MFTGFTTSSPATTFYARIKETATHLAGAAGNTGAVLFTKLDDRAAPTLDYSITMSGGDGFPKTITITPVAGAEYKFNNDLYSSTNTYTSNSPEIATLYIRLAATDTHNASPAATATVNTANQEQDAPSSFTLIVTPINDTTYTVTVPETAGAEYSFDGTNWSGNNAKFGCLPGETITGYKRMAAKLGYNASPPVSDSVTLPLFTVAKPTATPNGGSFITSQSVTLSCATAGASVYYTTDGSMPTTGSTRYSGAFTITDTTTVKAIAVKSGMNDSGVLTVTFTKTTALSSDATLSALSVSGAILNPAFASAVTSYTATVANSVNSVIVMATPNHPDATVSGTGAKSLSVGANIITVTVTAKDGTIKTYTITITRESSGGGGNTGNNGGSSGDSGGGSSGDRRNDSTTSVSAPTPVTRQEVLDAFNKALANLTPGQTAVTVRFVNRASLPLDVLKALADAAEKAGVTAIIHADRIKRRCTNPA